MVTINMSIEPLVREALGAAIAQDSRRSAGAVLAMSEPEDHVQDCFDLATAIAAFTLFDLYEGERPSDDQLRALAASFAATETWAGVDQSTALTLLTALADQKPVADDTSTDELLRIIFVLAAWLLASFGPPQEIWYQYLDRVLHALNTATDT